RVAARALIVGHLRKANMVLPGGEIHVVVASPASGSIRCQVGTGLRRAELRIMACLTAAGVRGELHCGPIMEGLSVTDYLIISARLYAGEAGTHMNFVNHHGQIHGVPRIGIGSLRRVA